MAEKRTETRTRTETKDIAPAQTDGGPAFGSADISALQGYVSMLAASMRLSDWEISLSFDPAMKDAHATIEAPDFQRRATLTLGPEFLGSTPSDRRDTLVHELLHLVLMGPWQYTDNLLEQEFPARLARVAWLAFCGHVESSIDHLAAVMAPSAPLPPALPSDARS